MSLQVVACPESESDLALAVCLLEAHGIPHLVHGGAFGALLPGPPIAGWNARRIMVPAAFVEEARHLLADVVVVPLASEPESAPAPGTLRKALEAWLPAWFAPKRDDLAR